MPNGHQGAAAYQNGDAKRIDRISLCYGPSTPGQHFPGSAGNDMTSPGHRSLNLARSLARIGVSPEHSVAASDLTAAERPTAKAVAGELLRLLASRSG